MAPGGPAGARAGSPPRSGPGLADCQAMANTEVAHVARQRGRKGERNPSRLEVDPGHLHFHVRMLHRAGLIELADVGGGREKPYRPVAKHFKVGPELRATGLASELQAAQLRELQRGFDLYAENGEFRSAQVHTKLDVETVRRLLDELVEKLTELEDDSQPLQTITIAFHPTIAQGDTD